MLRVCESTGSYVVRTKLKSPFIREVIYYAKLFKVIQCENLLVLIHHLVELPP